MYLTCAGSIRSGRLQTSICEYSGVWSSLTKWQKRGVTSLYQHHCDCRVSLTSCVMYRSCMNES